tara:strand:- start:138 stop:461 length:324 start_codon:yes stop_codon:yes gene_type:complete
MTTPNLQYLRDDIEKMEPIHQTRIFNIIKKSDAGYTKNKNGVFINMSLLDSSVINEIKSYLIYVDLQSQQLKKVEEDKEQYLQKYYNGENEGNKDSKGNKDIVSLEE